MNRDKILQGRKPSGASAPDLKTVDECLLTVRQLLSVNTMRNRNLRTVGEIMLTGYRRFLRLQITMSLASYELPISVLVTGSTRTPRWALSWALFGHNNRDWYRWATKVTMKQRSSSFTPIRPQIELTDGWMYDMKSPLSLLNLLKKKDLRLCSLRHTSSTELDRIKPSISQR